MSSNSYGPGIPTFLLRDYLFNSKHLSDDHQKDEMSERRGHERPFSRLHPMVMRESHSICDPYLAPPTARRYRVTPFPFRGDRDTMRRCDCCGLTAEVAE